MAVRRGEIEGVLVITSNSFSDQRGFFRETYRKSELAEALGRMPEFHQNNHSRSSEKVLRGFHTEAWDKLVYVVHGTALFVVADGRPGSATYGRTESFMLGDPPGEYKRVFVSEGLSNAFYCFTEVDYSNDVSREFDPTKRGGILWSDPLLNVDWPDRDPIISDNDANLPTLSEVSTPLPTSNQT